MSGVIEYLESLKVSTIAQESFISDKIKSSIINRNLKKEDAEKDFSVKYEQSSAKKLTQRCKNEAFKKLSQYTVLLDKVSKNINGEEATTYLQVLIKTLKFDIDDFNEALIAIDHNIYNSKIIADEKSMHKYLDELKKDDYYIKNVIKSTKTGV